MSDVLFGLEDAAAARATDPITSHEAAAAASSHVWESQQAVLELLRMWGNPVTSKQVEDIADARGLMYSESRIRSALPELEVKGLVERVGFTSPPRGRRRTLWALTGRADA